jgi:O-antigen ligase
VFLTIAGVIFLCAIVLSGTRSAMGIAAGMLIWIALREKRPIISISLVSLLLIATFFLLPYQVKSRLGLTPDVDKAAQTSNERRETYYQFGPQLFLENPFTGIGLEGFAYEYSMSNYRYLRGDEGENRIAHNMYLEFAIGTGLLGLIPFLLIVASAWIGLQRAIQDAPSELLRDLAKMTQISLTAYLFIGLFSSTQYDKLLWLVIGIAAITPLLLKLQTDTDTL